MNTGLQDAHNICWKLEAVHRGLAGERLLASYDVERRPVAHSNARLAVHNYERGLRVAEALGLPSSAPQSAADAMGALRRAVPQRISGFLLSEKVQARAGTAVDVVRTRMLESLGARAAATGQAEGDAGNAGAPGSVGTLFGVDTDAGTNRGGGRDGRTDRRVLGPLADRLDLARLERAASVVENGQSLPLLFPRHELGFVYSGPRAATLPSEGHAMGAGRGHHSNPPGLPAAGAQAHLLGWNETEAQVEDETLRLHGEVGSRLPHHWLTTDSGVRVSSLDLLHGARAAEAVAAADVSASEDAGEASSPTHVESLSSISSSRVKLPTPSPPRFTLLIDAAGRGNWGGGAALLPRGTPLQVVAIADAPSEKNGRARDARAALGVGCDAAGLEIATVFDDQGGWAQKIGASRADVALLVRPDGHIAWRGESTEAEGNDSCRAVAARLENVIGRILCRAGADNHACRT